jgi:thioredoxin-like negative regulator of GroEL
MNHITPAVLKDENLQWLSVLAFMYFQQNQYSKALPLLEFLHKHDVFKLSVDIQLIQCLNALKYFEKAQLIIHKCLNHSLSDEHQSVLTTLRKLNQLTSRQHALKQSTLCHE